LVQQNAEEEQMQDGGRGSILRAARRRCDRFAYRLDVCLLLPAFGILLKQDSGRLLLICDVV
jgi:hypothetical protein